MDGLIRAKEPGRELVSSIVIDPGVNRFSVHYKVLIYLIAEFAGKVEEIGRHVSGRGAVDASFAVSMLSSQVVHCIQRIERYHGTEACIAAGFVSLGHWSTVKSCCYTT